MFYAAGRHSLAGIAAAFAGVSGGFSANFIADRDREALDDAGIPWTKGRGILEVSAGK